MKLHQTMHYHLYSNHNGLWYFPPRIVLFKSKTTMEWDTTPMHCGFPHHTPQWIVVFSTAHCGLQVKNHNGVGYHPHALWLSTSHTAMDCGIFHHALWSSSQNHNGVWFYHHALWYLHNRLWTNDNRNTFKQKLIL